MVIYAEMYSCYLSISSEPRTGTSDIVNFQSYWNGCCGLILALSVPLPSSIGRNTPGWSIATVNNDNQKVDVVIHDNHWSWITLYTSWDLLFAWMYYNALFRALFPLIVDTVCPKINSKSIICGGGFTCPQTDHLIIEVIQISNITRVVPRIGQQIRTVKR